VSVRAATLTDDESQHYFGASLADHGIQTVWVSVDNAGDTSLRFLPIVTDATYFSAAEVEELLGAWWRGNANSAIASILARSQMPEIIPQKKTVTGFVFTHREGGRDPAMRSSYSGSYSRSAGLPTPSKRLILERSTPLARS
jgi:hypothetical protein